MPVLRGLRSRRVAVAVIVAVLALSAVAVYRARHDLYRQVALARVAQLAATEDTTGEELALTLMRHVNQLAPHRPDAVIDDSPLGTLVRGWGWCDAAANAFAQVAARRGLDVRLLSLWKPDGTSPHTVAAVRLDGEWKIFDVFEGAVSRLPDGELATADDIAAGRAQSTAHWIEPAWYGDARVFWDSPRPGTTRRTLRDAVWFAADALAHTAANPLQDLYLLTPPRPHVATDGTVWSDWSQVGEAEYWRARHYHLLGRLDQASDHYRLAIAVDSRFAAAAKYHLAHIPSDGSA